MIFFSYLCVAKYSATIKNKYPDSWILQVANGKAVKYKK